MARHLLSNIHVRNAMPRDKPYRLKDGEGLFLYVPPSGVRAWQFRVQAQRQASDADARKIVGHGLAEARRRAAEARTAAADGKHLTTLKRVERAKTAADESATFESVAHSWMSKRRAFPWSSKHAKQVRASIENHLSPLKSLPITEINARVVTPVLAKLERKAPLMFEKVRGRLHRILDHAVTLGVLERNPLPAPEPEHRKDRRHYPAVTDLQELGAILRAARATDPAKGIVRANTLAAFTAQRITEVVGAEWSEFDFDNELWAIPRSRMKRKDASRGPHQIPLPPALLASLKEWKTMDGEDALLVCPAPSDSKRSITPEGVEKYYREALGLHSPHSWRAAFSTIARDAGKPDEVIKAQLDHQVGNKTDSAYDRSKRLRLRRALLKWYEERLIAARDGA